MKRFYSFVFAYFYKALPTVFTLILLHGTPTHVMSQATTTRVDVAADGTTANDVCYGFRNAISGNGRYVAFYSSASNLVAGDTNENVDVFVRDLVAGTTIRVSVASDGRQGIGPHQSGFDTVSISADGRYIAFTSEATNLVAGDANGNSDVFRRDTVAGTTEMVSVATDGTHGNRSSKVPSISADGRYVTFWSIASNLVQGDTNNGVDIFVRDTVAGTTKRASVSSSGGQAFDPSPYLTVLAISADGQYVAFQSLASNLVSGDTNGVEDIFVRDTVAGTTKRVSVDSDGAEMSGSWPSISADGRYVVFRSSTNIFVRDTVAGTTRPVHVKSESPWPNTSSTHRVDSASISADGRYVVFDIDPFQTQTRQDYVVVRDRAGRTTQVVSVDLNGTWIDPCDYPCISADGRYVVFIFGGKLLARGPLSYSVRAYDANDIAYCLRIAAGLINATGTEVTRYDVDMSGYGIAIADATRIARKVAGLDPNP